MARLNLPPDEIEKFIRELTVIVNYFEQLKEIDTEGIEPRNQFIKAGNVFREDKTRPSLPHGKALGNAPDSDGEHFLVPRVIR